MSYLLDALNKSRGEPTDNPNSGGDYAGQPVMYPHPSFSGNEGINVYKWISIVLALVLTLIVGIFVGNRYALFSVPQSQYQSVPATAQTGQPQATEQTATQTPVEQSQTPAVDITKAIVNNTPQTQQQTQPTVQQVQTTTQQTNEVVTPTQPEPQMVISGNPVGQQTTPQLPQAGDNVSSDDNISSDLLSRFNQAIRESEAMGGDFDETEETEYKLEEYLTKVPQLHELDMSEQAKVPGFTYDTHLYASDPAKRQVKLNGATFIEKEWISDQVQIYEIQRQFLIFEMGHIRFSLPALTDWQEVSP